MSAKPEYIIRAWSWQDMTARYNWPCENCGGVIPKGTPYLCHVVRQGTRVGKDPLRRMRVHLDCQAPWYHVSDHDRMRNLRQLPHRVPPPEEIGPSGLLLRLAVSGRTPSGSEFTVNLSPEFSQRILHARGRNAIDGALAEIAQNMSLTLHALEAGAGRRKQGLQTSHALHELQIISGFHPAYTNHELDPETLVGTTN